MFVAIIATVTILITLIILIKLPNNIKTAPDTSVKIITFLAAVAFISDILAVNFFVISN